MLIAVNILVGVDPELYLFNLPCALIVTVGAVFAAAFAAMPALEVVRFGKNDEAVFAVVKIFRFKWARTPKTAHVIAHALANFVLWLTKVGRKSYSDAYLRGMQFRSLVPNAFTMANLVSGCLAIYFLFTEGEYKTPALFILLAAVFDVFDGLAARMLRVTGDIGKQLDSLADAVSFGVAPALMVVYLLSQESLPSEWMAFTPLLLVVASVYRLAKFNVDVRQSDRFIGLPTPANALFWIAVCHMFASGHIWSEIIRYETIVPTVVLMSWWMISEVPLIALKFKGLDFNANRFRYLLIGSALVVIVVSEILMDTVFPAIPIILLLYLLVSIMDQRSIKKHDLSRRN